MKKRHPASHQPRRDSPGLFEGNVLSEYRWRDGVNGRFAAQRPPTASKRTARGQAAPREPGEGRRLVRTIVRRTQLVEVLVEVDAALGEREAEDLVRTRLVHDEALLGGLDWQPAPAEVVWCAAEDAGEDDVAAVRLDAPPRSQAAGASVSGPPAPDAPSPEAKASSRGPGKTQQGGSSHECTEDSPAHRKGPLAARTPRG